jgi:hypothetical protein
MSNKLKTSYETLYCIHISITANVCVSAVVPFQMRVLSNENKRGKKINIYSLHVTAPLQKHAVGGCVAYSTLHLLHHIKWP